MGLRDCTSNRLFICSFPKINEWQFNRSRPVTCVKNAQSFMRTVLIVWKLLVLECDWVLLEPQHASSFVRRSCKFWVCSTWWFLCTFMVLFWSACTCALKARDIETALVQEGLYFYKVTAFIILKIMSLLGVAQQQNVHTHTHTNKQTLSLSVPPAFHVSDWTNPAYRSGHWGWRLWRVKGCERLKAVKG